MAFRDITTDHMGLQTTLASLTLAAAAGFAGSAHAAYTSYFGEDLNDSETTPLASTPKADLARQTFLSKLINVGTETFETQSVGTPAPLVLKFPGSNGNVTATLTGGDGIVKSVTPGTTDDSGRYSVPSASTSRYWDVAAGAGLRRVGVGFVGAEYHRLGARGRCIDRIPLQVARAVHQVVEAGEATGEDVAGVGRADGQPLDRVAVIDHRTEGIGVIDGQVED